MDTRVLFFSKEIILPILKVHPLSFIEELFAGRRTLLQNSISHIERTQDIQFGALPEFMEQVEPPSMKAKSPIKTPAVMSPRVSMQLKSNTVGLNTSVNMSFEKQNMTPNPMLF